MSRIAGFGVFLALGAIVGCGGSSRNASAPHALAGRETITAASIDKEGGGAIDKILVAENGSVSVVERDGCMATVQETKDEIHTRCAKPDRMKQWFAGADKALAKVAVAPMTKADRAKDEDEIDTKTPSAKMLTATGKALKVTNKSDVDRLNAEVRALSDELAGAEKQVTPGPASEGGWQMLHVGGPAHVMFAGSPTRGVLEARMSTTGQYVCTFTTAGDHGPVQATKSGWIKPSSAARAIDVVLGPMAASSSGDARAAAFAAGTKAGAEQRSGTAATAAVFALFSELQDALGDACLPELEAPAGPGNAPRGPQGSTSL